MSTPGQRAFAAWHGLALPLSPEEWPAGDCMVSKWEAVGAAVLAVASVVPLVESRLVSSAQVMHTEAAS